MNLTMQPTPIQSELENLNYESSSSKDKKNQPIAHLILDVLILELEVPVPEVGLHGGDQVVCHVPLLLDLCLQLLNDLEKK